MLASEVLFLIFVIIPMSFGYVAIIFYLTRLAWNIKEYFVARKEYMQTVINNKENNND